MRKIFLYSSLTASIIAIATLVLTSANPNPLSRTNANLKSYGITFDSGRNKFHEHTGITAYDGNATVKTDLGNDIGFTYYQLMGLKNTWHVLANGGYFYNTDPIHGMQSITLSFNTDGASYSVSYSNDTSFNQLKNFTSKKGGIETFDFDGYQPNYFKIINTSGKNLNIPSIRVSLSCLNNYPTVNLINENMDMGAIEGGGVKRAGSIVTLTATPNKGYRFLGWYDNESLISSDSSYTFIIGNDDLSYVAKFTYESYDLVVESESTEKGTVSESSGKYDYLDNVSINATANKGYSFDGWYSESTLVSKENSYTFAMPYSNVTYTAKFNTNKYVLSLNNENESLGSISGEGTFLYGSDVTITATPNTGVSFLGWYGNDGTLVSSLKSYSFKMPYEDILYTAKFEWAPYSISININDTSMGTITGDGSYTYGQNVSLVATPNDHYSFFGWYDGEKLLSQDSSYSFSMPDKSLAYSAKFVKKYKLNVSTEDMTKGSIVSPVECGEGLEVTIRAKANDGYVLDYWYDDDLNEISYNPNYTFTMPGNDVSLYALFTTGGYAFSVSSEDDSKGTVNDVSNRYKEGTIITAVGMPADSCVFEGWYNNEFTKISTDPVLRFTMPKVDYSLVARFLTKKEADTIKYAKDPIFSSDGKTVKYGLYPQRNINDEDLISSLNMLTITEPNGWYFYDGDYYAKTTAKPYKDDYCFDNGISILKGTTYWFRCEPIIWNIIDNNNGEYYLVSNILLDTYRFYNSQQNRVINGQTVYSNNYEYSDIRKWLNGDFYDSAFMLGDSCIQVTVADNSASTTNSPDNKYACSNTEDKVFLPSYQDYFNDSYGFDSNELRECKVTDWARATGAFYYTDTRYLSNGRYWTRSPYYASCSAWRIDYDGFLNVSSFVDCVYNCVRPALSIKAV
ncbi:MAG: DUF6273 domain-containing protein [Candidatus Enteromonas sp.]|nr:DUF6273 domain-containing protein [Candidatus Enteromonas sp.]